MEDALAEDGKERQHTLESGALAPGEDGDVTGRRPVAAARYRAVESGPAGRRDPQSEPPYLGGIGGTHLQPDLARAESREHPVGRLHHLGAGRRRGQAGDHDIDRCRQLAWRGCALRAACEKGVDPRAVEVAHGEIDSLTLKVAGELTADIAEADEAYTQIDHAQ